MLITILKIKQVYCQLKECFSSFRTESSVFKRHLSAPYGTLKREGIVMDSLRFLVADERVWVYGYVIIPNHIHILWRKQDAWVEKSVQQQFLKFTAQQIKFNMSLHYPLELENYRSTQATDYIIFGKEDPTKQRFFLVKYVSRSSTTFIIIQ